MTENIFNNQRAIPTKLTTFGFQGDAHTYTYKQPLLDQAFTLTVTVTLPNNVTTTLSDQETGEPYTLHLAANNTGDFVARVREAYQAALHLIQAQCFEPDVFAEKQARALIQHVTATYHDDLEFLWKKFPGNAVWRRADTHKWYAALLKVPQSKLGLAGDEIITIIDLRLATADLAKLIDSDHYFPGYHMNKNHWYSIILDGRVTDAEIFDRLQTSYDLAH